MYIGDKSEFCGYRINQTIKREEEKKFIQKIGLQK